jgi:hypothetical protein
MPSCPLFKNEKTGMYVIIILSLFYMGVRPVPSMVKEEHVSESRTKCWLDILKGRDHSEVLVFNG